MSDVIIFGFSDGNSDDTNIYHFKETDQSDLKNVTIILAAEG